MEIFLNLWNNWCNIEKVQMALLFFSLLVLISFGVKFITKNNSLFFFTIASLLSSAIFTLSGIFFLHTIFNLTITHIFLLVPVVVLFLNVISIGTCIGYYKQQQENKNFNISVLKKEYVKDTIQTSIFILLLFSAVSVFLTSSFFALILITGLLSLSTIWFNYILLCKLVK